ncbi:MAG: glycosyltransferase [Candidatus Paceibacterota bacterium]
MKVAIVFDNQTRSETTGFYCRRALSRLADVEHLLPSELSEVPESLFNLFVFVDDGLDYPIPEHLRPRAAWAIDTHISFARCISRFGDADWLYAAQKMGASEMQASLGREVTWLPLACDPERHRPISREAEQFDFAFVGHEIGHRRIDMLNRLRASFPNHWVGQAYHTEMARRYSQCRVAFNCSVGGDVNMRLFEAVACGKPLVTDAIGNNGLEELFDLDAHLRCYSDPDSLVAEMERLLSDEPLRRRQAESARQHVVNCHTYTHRMQRILELARKGDDQHVRFSPPPQIRCVLRIRSSRCGCAGP